MRPIERNFSRFKCENQKYLSRGRERGFVKIFKNIVMISVVTFVMSGCAVVKNIVEKERNNRGGYTDYAADKFLIANTNKMRVLRAYAVTAAMSGLALEVGLGEAERQQAAVQLASTMEFLNEARRCANEHLNCIYVDTRLFNVNKSVFGLAKTILPLEEVRRLVSITNLGSTAVQSLLGLGRSSLRLSGKLIKGTLRVAAIYRDTWNLYMIVYGDYLEAHSADNLKYAAAKKAIKDAYMNGAGDIAKWKELVRHKDVGLSETFSLLANKVEPEEKHIKSVVDEIMHNCLVLSGISKLTTCEFDKIFQTKVSKAGAKKEL